MSGYMIERSAPALRQKPKPKQERRRYQRYPFKDMAVGDSFLVPKDMKKRIAPAASRAAKRNGLRFTIRAVADGYRVWRTK